MLMIYDKEDFDPSTNATDAPAFLKRTICYMVYVRTDSFDKTTMQNWVKEKDGVATVNGKNWVYNHYVPHSRIQKAIQEIIVRNEISRETAIEWLISIALELKIEADQKLAASNWGDSRVAYDVWMDWAVSAICDWKENIFYGPGLGDERGTALDIPKNSRQLARVKRAAAKLHELIPADPPLSIEKIFPEELVGNEEHDPFIRNAQADEEAKEFWREVFETGEPVKEDAGDEDWDPDEYQSDESDMEGIVKFRIKVKKSGIQKKKAIRKKKSPGISPYQKSRAVTAEKRKKRKENKKKKNQKGQK